MVLKEKKREEELEALQFVIEFAFDIRLRIESGILRCA